MSQETVQQVKTAAEELLRRLDPQFSLAQVQAKAVPAPSGETEAQPEGVQVGAWLQEPQFLIGQNGQTLDDIQRLLRLVVARQAGRNIRLTLDINGYREKKNDYLKRLAQQEADQAVALHQERILPPMNAYERRIVHMELSQRSDITCESRGEGQSRKVAIVPKA